MGSAIFVSLNEVLEGIICSTLFYQSLVQFPFLPETRCTAVTIAYMFSGAMCAKILSTKIGEKNKNVLCK